MSLFNVYPRFDITLTKGKGVYVYDNNNKQYLDLYGGHGVISVIANALPKKTCTLVEEALAGYNDQAANAAKELEEVLGLIFKEGNPVGVKAYLKKLGIGNGRLRLPLVEASTDLYHDIEEAHQKMR